MADLEVTQLLELANTQHGPASLDEDWSPPDHDHLASPESARAYLVSRAFAPPPGLPTERQLSALRELRDLARTLIDIPEERWRPQLGRAAGKHLFRFDASGRPVPADSGWDGFIAAFVPPLFDLAGDAARLRRCANPGCRWLFLDRSKNHSRVWCEMATCGSRAKMSRYRSRRAGSRGATGSAAH